MRCASARPVCCGEGGDFGQTLLGCEIDAWHVVMAYEVLAGLL